MTSSLGFCSKCGTAVSEAGQQFCGKCGASLAAVAAAAAAAPAAQAAPAWTSPPPPPPPPAAVMPPGAPMMPPPGAPPWAGYPGAPYGVPGNKGSLLPIFLVLGLVGVLIVGGVIFAIVALKPPSSSTPGGSGGSNAIATFSGGSPSHATATATATIPVSTAGGSITFDPDTFGCSDPGSVTSTVWLPASVSADTTLLFALVGAATEPMGPGSLSDFGFVQQSDGRWRLVTHGTPEGLCSDYLQEDVVGDHIARVLDAATDAVLAQGTFTITGQVTY